MLSSGYMVTRDLSVILCRIRFRKDLNSLGVYANVVTGLQYIVNGNGKLPSHFYYHSRDNFNIATKMYKRTHIIRRYTIILLLSSLVLNEKVLILFFSFKNPFIQSMPQCHTLVIIFVQNLERFLLLFFFFTRQDKTRKFNNFYA